MYLFLQGTSHIGKSTILRNALMPYQKAVAGLMVQRLLEGSQVCGFRACIVNGALPALEKNYHTDLEGIFLHNHVSYLDVLENAVSKAAQLCQRESCKLIILDEIGGFELTSQSFMQSLESILSLGKPCLGVIKSFDNLNHTANKLNLPNDVLYQSEKLYRRIKAEGKVITVRDGDLTETAQYVRDYCSSIFRVELPSNSATSSSESS